VAGESRNYIKGHRPLDVRSRAASGTMLLPTARLDYALVREALGLANKYGDLDQKGTHPLWIGGHNMTINKRNSRLAALIFCLAFGFTIWANSSEESVSAHEGHMHAPLSARKMKNPLAATAEDIASGRDLYNQHCASCHGKDGKAQTMEAGCLTPKPADLTGHRLHALTDGEIYWVITHGIRASAMPALEDKASDLQRWQITTYVRQFSPMATP
jgi:mono/diheme cytochrome c family protein